MSGGGKGGSTTSETKIPKWLDRAAQGAVNQGQAVGQIGYTPYYGPDVAALTRPQVAAMKNTASAAGAFGMSGANDPMAAMPQAERFANGMRGYSSASLYEQALADLQARHPGQFDFINSFFVDPQTGARPAGYGPGGVPGAGQGGTNEPPPTTAQLIGSGLSFGEAVAQSRQPNSYMHDGPAGGNVNYPGGGAPSGGGGGGGFFGYDSWRDMRDGGGPGASGNTFQGGGLVSGLGNMLGGPGNIGRDGGLL